MSVEGQTNFCVITVYWQNNCGNNKSWMPAMIWGRAVESRTCGRRIVMQRTHLKELSRVVLSIYKITLKLKKREHNSLLRQNNIRDIITNHKETRMVKDGDDWHRLQTTNLKKLGLTFQVAQTLMRLSVSLLAQGKNSLTWDPYLIMVDYFWDFGITSRQ